jgi:hypothetical protein
MHLRSEKHFRNIDIRHNFCLLAYYFSLFAHNLKLNRSIYLYIRGRASSAIYRYISPRHREQYTTHIAIVRACVHMDSARVEGWHSTHPGAPPTTLKVPPPCSFISCRSGKQQCCVAEAMFLNPTHKFITSNGSMIDI